MRGVAKSTKASKVQLTKVDREVLKAVKQVAREQRSLLSVAGGPHILVPPVAGWCSIPDMNYTMSRPMDIAQVGAR